MAAISNADANATRIGEDAVGDGQRVAVVVPDAAASAAGAIAGEGAVEDGAAVAEQAAAAVGRAVAGEGAVGDRQRAALVPDATAVLRAIAGEGAVGDRQRAGGCAGVELKMPPPPQALLLEKGLLVTVSLPASLKMPPP